MNSYLAEFIGTTILILLGNGVVANVVLKKTKGHDAGLMAITAGWGFAVFTAVQSVGHISGGHLNPAVTIGLAIAGKFNWEQAPFYIIAQMAGGILGASCVYLFYRPHYQVTPEPDDKLATFCTAPAIRNPVHNVFCEAVGTFVLIYAVLMMSDPEFQLQPDTATITVGLGSAGAILVGLIVFGIGLSLGGTTGYASNPARDLGPRIAHALLPVPGKRDSDWSYAWVPVLGPVIGGILAALLFCAHG